MADQDVNIGVNVENEGALKALDEIEKQGGKSVDAVEKAFGALKVAAAAAVAAFTAGAVVDFFGEGVKAAEAQQAALASLAAQLSQTGENTDEAVASFVALGDELEKTSKFEDDAVIAAAALAKSFGITNKQADELTRAAVELSAATGDSLEGSVRKLGKTYSGVTGSLDEQIGALKGLTKEQLANGEAIKVVLERYGGTAAGQLDNFAGKLSLAEKAFGNIQEVFGEIITTNPVVLAGIDSLAKAFENLQGFAEANKDSVSDFVSFGVKAIAVSVPIAVDTIGFFTRALEGLVTVGALAFGGLTEIVSAFGSTFGEIIRLQGDTFLGFLELVAQGVTSIPGVGAALEAIGIDASGAAEGISTLRATFNEVIDGGQAAVDGFRDSVSQFTVDAVEGFEQFNEGFDEVSQNVSDLAQSVFDADEKITVSAKKAAAGRRAIIDASKIDPKELQKLADEAAKFAQAITTESLSELDKIQAKRDQDLAKLEEYFEKGAIGAKEFEAARSAATKAASDKIGKILEDDTKKYEEELKKRKELLRAQVQEASTTPIKFAVEKLDLKPISEGLQTSLASTVGALGKILEGKSGAKSVVAEGVGALADSFIPGIGGAVGGLVNKLAEGPDAVKTFIKGFVDGVPSIIDAIAQSIPVVVETLVDTLITKGGIVKIAVSLGKGILTAVAGIFKSLGSAFSKIDFGSIFGKVGGLIGKSFKETLPDFKGLFASSVSSITEPIKKLFSGDIAGALKDAIFKPFEVISNLLPARIREPFNEFIDKFKEGFSNLGTAIVTQFKDGLPDFKGLFTDAFNGIVEPFKKLFSGDIAGFLKDGITKPFEVVSNLLPKKIREPFDNFLEKITGFFDGIDLGGKFGEWANELIEPIRKLFSGDFQGFIDAAFKKPLEFFEKFKFSVPDWIEKLKVQEPEWLRKFTDAIEKLSTLGGTLSDPVSGKKGKDSSLLGNLGKSLGLADGGLIPPGFPNDSFYLRGNTFAQSSERVLNEDQNRGLIKLLEQIAMGKNVGGGPGAVQVTLQVGERQLAQVLVDLNRQGFRTA